MAKLNVQQIKERARAIVAENPGGIRAILLNCHKDKVVEYDPEEKRVTISPLGLDYVETKIVLEA